MTPESTIHALWGTWLTSWAVAMLWANRSEKRDALGAALLFRVLFYAGLIMLFAFPPRAKTQRPRSFENSRARAIPRVREHENLGPMMQCTPVFLAWSY